MTDNGHGNTPPGKDGVEGSSQKPSSKEVIHFLRLIGTLFILAMFALIGSLWMLLREVFLAVKVGRHDILVKDILR